MNGGYHRGNTAPHDLPLTNRQIQVVRLIACGYTNPEIAAELNVSVRTAKYHADQLRTHLRCRHVHHARPPPRTRLDHPLPTHPVRQGEPVHPTPTQDSPTV